MKVPKKMKSGTKLNTTRYLPEIFYITLLSLDGILKRYGVKDAYVFKKHNKEEEYDFSLLSSGIHFNLFSEYGIGKSLLPLIRELLTNIKLDPQEHKNNIIYKEIVRLVPEVLPLIREADSDKETKWSYNYALKMLPIMDDLSQERDDRLGHLTHQTKGDSCKCNFCIQFRKHHFQKPKHIDWYIIDTILAIDKEVNPQ